MKSAVEEQWHHSRLLESTGTRVKNACSILVVMCCVISNRKYWVSHFHLPNESLSQAQRTDLGCCPSLCFADLLPGNATKQVYDAQTQTSNYWSFSNKVLENKKGKWTWIFGQIQISAACVHKLAVWLFQADCAFVALSIQTSESGAALMLMSAGWSFLHTRVNVESSDAAQITSLRRVILASKFTGKWLQTEGTRTT